jgi:hypothetical protein
MRGRFRSAVPALKISIPEEARATITTAARSPMAMLV